MERKDISAKISSLERELIAPRSRASIDRNKKLDEMVSDLANAKTAEKLRIFKLVEAQFDAIEQQVKDEVAHKMETQKKEKEENLRIRGSNAEEILKKSAKLRKDEIKRQKVTTYKKSAIPKMVSPRKPGKNVSFSKKSEEEGGRAGSFKVLKEKDVNAGIIPLSAPVIIDRCDKDQENKGLFQMKHVGLDPREKLQKLSCHRLPGVDIRPGLVIENIPGLSFEGYNRKPNRRIAVEHVFSSGEDPALDDGNDDLCPTESTTSRFEKMEKMVEESHEKEREAQHIQRYVTKEQLLVIERDLIKKRLPQILKDFNEVSARVSRSEGSIREESLKTDSQSKKSNISQQSQNL